MSMSIREQELYKLSKKLIDKSWENNLSHLLATKSLDKYDIEYMKFLVEATLELTSMYGESMYGEENLDNDEPILEEESNTLKQAYRRISIIEALVQRRESRGQA